MFGSGIVSQINWIAPPSNEEATKAFVGRRGFCPIEKLEGSRRLSDEHGQSVDDIPPRFASRREKACLDRLVDHVEQGHSASVACNAVDEVAGHLGVSG